MTMPNTLKNQDELLALVWQFHSVLNTCWPKPGVSAMAGASIFIGTKYFKSLEDFQSKIQIHLNSIENPKIKGELVKFWDVFKELFSQLKTRNRGEKNPQIDQAFNLLYLASGVFYHRLVEVFSLTPTFDKRLIGVENLNSLAKLCKWRNPNTTLSEIFDDLIGEMNILQSAVHRGTN